MKENTKRIGMLALLGVLLLVFLLSASLNDLELAPGTPFPGIGSSEASPQTGSSSSSDSDLSFPLLQGVLALFLLAWLVYVPLRLIAAMDLRKFLKHVGVIVIIAGLLLMIPNIETAQTTSTPPPSTVMTDPVVESFPTQALGKPPQVLEIAVTILAAAGLVILVLVLVKQSGRAPEQKEGLLQEAEEAFNALRAGEDLDSVIMRCYLQMTRALQEEQGIDRQTDMTAREFESILERKGFPAGPVRSLTALFEKVRYSTQPVSPQDQQIALESLGEIINFSKGAPDRA